MKLKSILYILIASIFISGCAKDNYDPPKSKLTGRIVYNGEPVSVRSGGVVFELWQHGYQLFRRIPLNIAQDGSFSALLFDGDYKLVRAKGSGPWLDNTDSIDVQVRNGSTLDVPVQPYYFLKDVVFEKNGAEVKATFSVQTINNSRALEYVRLFIGPNYILDLNNNSANKQANLATININQPITLTATIPSSLANESFIYARVGVKTTGIAELLYSQSQKVQLK